VETKDAPVQSSPPVAGMSGRTNCIGNGEGGEKEKEKFDKTGTEI
jgi:hypothetical protein